MKISPLPLFYISTGLSLVTLGDFLLYAILPSYYPILGLARLQVGILLSANRWIRLATNHMAEYCYRRYSSDLWLLLAFFMGSVVTAMYGIAKIFLILLIARILWPLLFETHLVFRKRFRYEHRKIFNHVNIDIDSIDKIRENNISFTQIFI
jgi:hypothetical protein